MEANNCFVFIDRKIGKTTYIPYRSVTHIEICKNKETVKIFYAITQSYTSELENENVSYMLKSYSEWLKNFQSD